MRDRVGRTVGLLALILTGFSCAKLEPVAGAVGEWVRGREVSVKLDIVLEDGDWEMGYLTIRNMSQGRFVVKPLRVVGTYSVGGKLTYEPPVSVSANSISPGLMVIIPVLGKDSLAKLRKPVQSPGGNTLEKAEVFIGRKEAFIITR